MAALVGGEWLAGPGQPNAAVAQGWQQGALARAIEEVRAQGLLVDLSGELAAGSALDPARAEAVALAVKQCLVNVLKHSGTDHADVIVYGSESEVSVMVVDDGRGFDESAVSPDRLGLRQSVRRRVQDAGGTVQVWSAPGRGTSVMIRVPSTAQQAEPVL
jgi:signal transduction histidine kinase